MTHYCYDGLDSDFVNDDLDANRVKIVDTHGATIAETTAELMNLFFLFYVYLFVCVGFSVGSLVRHRFCVRFIFWFFFCECFTTNNIQRKYTDCFFLYIYIRSKQRVNRNRERRREKKICREGVFISDTIEK